MSMQYKKQDYVTTSCTADKNKYLCKHDIKTSNLVSKEDEKHFAIIFPYVADNSRYFMDTLIS